MRKATQIPLVDAAMRLGLTYHQCRTKLLKGDLAGGRDEFGRLYVDETALKGRSAKHASDRVPNPKSRERHV